MRRAPAFSKYCVARQHVRPGEPFGKGDSGSQVRPEKPKLRLVAGDRRALSRSRCRCMRDCRPIKARSIESASLPPGVEAHWARRVWLLGVDPKL